MRRRTFMKGLTLGASAAVLTPMLDDAFAEEQGSLPKRLVIVQIGNGLAPSYFWGETFNAMLREDAERSGNPRRKIGSSYDAYTNQSPLVDSLSDDLSAKSHLEPLASRASEIAVLHGLSCKRSGGGHYTNFGALSCAPGTARPEGATLDTVIGETLSRGKPFDVLRLGVSDLSNKGVTISLQDSAFAAGRPAPVFLSPRAAFEGLFGSVLGENSKAMFDKRGRLLDMIHADTKQAMSTLTGGPRLRMEHYLHSLEVLETRQTMLTSLDDTLRACVPDAHDGFTSSHPGERLGAHFDLAAASLVCGLTNVVLLGTGTGRSTGCHWTDFQTEDDGEFPSGHGLGHGAGYAGKSGSHWMSKILRLHTEGISRLISTLEAVPEGDGTMWDHTAILFQTSNHESHHSRQKTWPAMLIGTAGGSLKTGGRGIIYPNKDQDGHKLVRNLYVTLAQACGVDIEDFGPDIGRGFGGPLSELVP